jgi:hypothetical protein
MDVTALTDASVSRFIEFGAASLSPMERLLVAIWGLEADVNNGGFSQYYFNSYGDFAAETPTHLRSIGAHQAAGLVEQANLAFGPGGPPSDRDERQCALERIEENAAEGWDALDNQFFSYPDDIAVLLTAYVEHSGGAV